ncbi:MAG: DinB family protein [Ignavibacteriae bacterium]|nr:DinB family protein [Ignavibacteriota bacterium]NOG99592.1 DinB family protein [Ignavibacteriota bacterium]
MSLTTSIALLKKERALILSVIDKLSDEQLLKIPAGYNNNVLWNLGHILITQQSLHYFLSRLEMYISREMIQTFRTGTSPSDWKTQPDIIELKQLFLELPDKFSEDYKKGIFKDYRPYKTSVGVSIDNFEEAVAFNHFHEGTHTGIILGLMKQI